MLASTRDDEDHLPIALNAMFESNLPSIIDKIGLGWCASRAPEISAARSAAAAFFDFLSFEIDKTDLRIKSERWKSIVDPNELAKLEAWQSKLVKIRDSYPIDDCRKTENYLGKLLDTIKDTFT